MHGSVVRQAAETIPPLTGEHLGHGQSTVIAKIALPTMIMCAGDMARMLIQWFDLAAITRRGACVDQLRDARYFIQRDQAIATWRTDELPCSWPLLTARDRATAIDPSLPATIEHRHLRVTHVAQHPPQTRGEHTTGIVIGHHLTPGVDTQRAEQCAQTRRRR